MGIKIYISSNNGNKELQNHQSRILMILKSLGIEFEAVDVSAPGTEKDRDYMRANGKKKEGDRNVLPPQIFNGDKFCGDYDDFDIANEDDVLEEFLGLPRKTPKVDPTKTDAVAAEPGKLEPGKLAKPGKLSKSGAANDDENTENTNENNINGLDDEHDNNNLKHSTDHEDNLKAVGIDDKVLEAELKDIEGLGANETTSDLANQVTNDDHAKSSEIDDDLLKNKALINDVPLIKKLSNDEDDTKTIPDLKLKMPKTIEEELELLRSPKQFMDDGEEIRDHKPGFQDLGNCKRFWKAQQLIGTP